MQRARIFFQRFRAEALYGLASALTSVVGVVSTVIAARFLRPVDLGIMQTLMLIPIYAAFLHLGVFNGLNRDIAFYQGRGDNEKVQRMVNSSWAVAKLVALAGIVISVGVTVYFWATGAPSLYLWGIIFVLATLVAEPLSMHLEVVYQSSRSFRPLAVRAIWQNLVTLLASFLPALAGAAGFVMARVIAAASRLSFRLFGVPIRATGPGSSEETRELARVGMPLLITGTLYTYFGAADRSVIAFFMTEQDVGVYALAGLAVTGVQFLPMVVVTLLYPRISALYGRTGSAHALRRYFWILLGSGAAVVAPVCVLAFYLVDPVTKRFLPAYAEGVPAARLASLASLSFVYYGLTSIIAVLRRNTQFIIAIGVALAVVWILGAYWVRHGFGILGAVWARTVASTMLCLFTIGFTYWLTRDGGTAPTLARARPPAGLAHIRSE
jgi:O-antigen/teichoic acid export membrane protein